MSSTIGDRMADFHWVSDDGGEVTAKADAADPDLKPTGEDAPQGAAAPAADEEEGDEIAPWAEGIDWGVVKREVAIMLKLNPNATIPDQGPEEGAEQDDQGEAEALEVQQQGRVNVKE
jgi:hypothetical protein